MIVYACTFVEKTAATDDYEHGCSTKSDCIIADPVNIEAESLPKLIEACGERFGLDIDDVFLPDDENGDVLGFGYNRLECGDSTEPSEHETEQWKKGELQLFLCDYYFAIEKREVSVINRKEFEAAGIKTH